MGSIIACIVMFLNNRASWRKFYAAPYIIYTVYIIDFFYYAVISDNNCKVISLGSMEFPGLGAQGIVMLEGGGCRSVSQILPKFRSISYMLNRRIIGRPCGQLVGMRVKAS